MIFLEEVGLFCQSSSVWTVHKDKKSRFFLERISLNQSGNDFDARKVRHAATTPQATVGGSLPETGDTSINVY